LCSQFLCSFLVDALDQGASAAAAGAECKSATKDRSIHDPVDCPIFPTLIQPVRLHERPGQRVTVTTDTFKAEIDTAGGDLRRVELLKYRDTLDAQKNFVLLEDDIEHTTSPRAD
jgi:YidC/Oxa1 family membrane protein insertase